MNLEYNEILSLQNTSDDVGSRKENKIFLFYYLNKRN